MAEVARIQCGHCESVHPLKKGKAEPLPWPTEARAGRGGDVRRAHREVDWELVMRVLAAAASVVARGIHESKAASIRL